MKKTGTGTDNFWYVVLVWYTVLWIRIRIDFGRLDRIQEGKNDPQKYEKSMFRFFKVLDVLF
jgi:hypothetical protein